MSPLQKRLPTSFALTLFLFFSSSLFAGEKPLVLVISDSNSRNQTLVARVVAELEAAGTSVISIKQNLGPHPHQDLKEIAQKHNGVAAIRLVSARDMVEIWLVDRVTGKTVLRQIEVVDDIKSDPIVAMRAVELLRASLLEIHTTHDRGDIAASPVIKEIAYIETEPAFYPSWFTIEAGPSMSVGGFGIDPLANVTLGIRMRPTNWLIPRIVAVFPLLPTRFQTGNGSAEIWASFVGGGAKLSFIEAGKRWTPALGGGIGASFVKVRTNETTLLESSDFAVALMPYINGGLSIALTDHIGVIIDMLVGWNTKEIQVNFDNQIATWDQALIMGYLGVEVFLGKKRPAIN